MNSPTPNMNTKISAQTTSATDIPLKPSSVLLVGEMEIKVPRDRNRDFEPQLVKKHQTDVSAIEDKIIFLYYQEISTRNMQKLYGMALDDSRIYMLVSSSKRIHRNLGLSLT
jgi:hypothetical protein